MKKVFECESDCPDVEKIIWKNIANNYGNFDGIFELDNNDLILLKHYIEKRLNGDKL